jgi:hypothetical protein
VLHGSGFAVAAGTIDAAARGVDIDGVGAARDLGLLAGIDRPGGA